MAVLILIVGLGLGLSAKADDILKGVGIDQHLGGQVPPDLLLVDSTGSPLKLDTLLHHKPILLTLVYYRCPGLCTFTLNRLQGSMNVLSESAGKDFDVLTVSFDPKETADLAAEKKKAYLRGYRRSSAEAGWHFCVGTQDQIERLTRAVGFKYNWDAANQMYAHSTALIVLTPEGKISRYFLGAEYPPNQVREALKEASTELVAAKPAEEIFLYCFKYSHVTGKYGLVIERAKKVLAVATIVAIASLIIGLSWYSSKSRKQEGVTP